MPAAFGETVTVRLALGTAQLGLPYGIVNRTEQPTEAVARQIVEESWAGGVEFFDTAQVYGTSEVVLGRCFRDLGIADRVRVVSKLDPATPIDQVESTVLRSCANLGVPRLWGLLVHSEALLDCWNGEYGTLMRRLKSSGLTEHLGVSIYSPQRAAQALDIVDLDVIQVPANVFDRRMDRSGFLRCAASRGRTVFIRSIYLQGLAMLNGASIPLFARDAVSTYATFCREHDVSRRKFAVDYVRHMSAESLMVIGAELPEQARENCHLVVDPIVERTMCAEWDRRWPEDQFPLVDPSQWPHG